MMQVPPNPGDPYLSGPLPPEPDDFQVAVAACTRAIRAINAGQRGGDGAEFVTHLLATVAANLGSSYAVIKARPGSWEADRVSALLASTVGEADQYLVGYRSEPVELVINSVYELDDLGLYETYEASTNHIGAVLFGNRWTRSRDRLTVDQLEQIQEIEQTLVDLEDADRAEFERRFTAAVTAEFERRKADAGGNIPAQLTVNVRFVNHYDNLTDGWEHGIASELYVHARGAVLLPGSDTTPDWSTTTHASSLLAAGHWPHLRIPELAHYGIPSTSTEQD
ncbi:hypothetical protein PWY87_16285 [Kribbella solani]|uniref:hypothetical protein n=1 Tax=Kribbella solani TaxID=236067 RepID=UPI0029BBB199|nr:hypothetical protein [Kribbella solani]MDX3003250.1 hypothetical protein [Kribbella solani]